MWSASYAPAVVKAEEETRVAKEAVKHMREDWLRVTDEAAMAKEAGNAARKAEKLADSVEVKSCHKRLGPIHHISGASPGLFHSAMKAKLHPAMW